MSNSVIDLHIYIFVIDFVNSTFKSVRIRGSELIFLYPVRLILLLTVNLENSEVLPTLEFPISINLKPKSLERVRIKVVLNLLLAHV